MKSEKYVAPEMEEIIIRTEKGFLSNLENPDDPCPTDEMEL